MIHSRSEIKGKKIYRDAIKNIRNQNHKLRKQLNTNKKTILIKSLMQLRKKYFVLKAKQ